MISAPRQTHDAGWPMTTLRDKRLAVSMDQARRLIAQSVEPLGGEAVSLWDAYDRILQEDVLSDSLIPPRDCSAMDGYAVRAADTAGAEAAAPKRLRVVGEIAAGGSNAGLRVGPGQAVRIMTGAPTPQGADAVVRVEDTAEAGGLVRIDQAVEPHTNYRRAGEHIAPGDLVLTRGRRLGSADVGILAALNRGQVQVYRRPTVAIISTGDELAGPGEQAPFDKIRDVNAHVLHAEVRKCNAIPRCLGIARDTEQEVLEMFMRALDSDVVISTGGVSMGKYDLVKSIYTRLGIEMRFEWVDVKPGKPCAFGTKGGKLYFGLPGNPVSTLTSFIQFVRPALLRLMGAAKLDKPVISATLLEDIHKAITPKTRMLRGRFTITDGEFLVRSAGDQRTSMFRSMSEANCLIVLPGGAAPPRAGDKVAIQLLEHDEV